MSARPGTPRITVRRQPGRGVYDRDTIYRIIDQALLCHVAFVSDGHPYVIPTTHVRVNDDLYLHGSHASRMLKCLATGSAATIAITLLDGLVLARSALHHSVNYRSVVIVGTATEVTESNEKGAVLRALVEHVIPGRYDDTRAPSANEIDATMVMRFPLNEMSAKIRTGPPVDAPEDYGNPTWAGVIPIATRAGTPVPDPKLSDDVALPAYVHSYNKRFAHVGS